MLARLALPPMVLGLFAVGACTSPAPAQQLIYDLSPELGHLEVYGYQQSVVEPAQPIITSPMVAPMTGGATGGGVSYSGGLSSYGGGAAGPAQPYTIYNPMAVAGMSGVTSRAEQTASWPPRGGPWGLGPVPAPPTMAASPGAELPEETLPTTPAPEGEELEEGESPAPTTGFATTPRPFAPPTADTALGTGRTTARQLPTSPLDPYLPSALLESRYHRDRSPRTAARSARDQATEIRGPAGLAAVYRQHFEDAPTDRETLPAPDEQPSARQDDVSRQRQLDSVYHRQSAAAKDEQ